MKFKLLFMVFLSIPTWVAAQGQFDNGLTYSQEACKAFKWTQHGFWVGSLTDNNKVISPNPGNPDSIAEMNAHRELYPQLTEMGQKFITDGCAKVNSQDKATTLAWQAMDNCTSNCPSMKAVSEAKDKAKQNLLSYCKVQGRNLVISFMSYMGGFSVGQKTCASTDKNGSAAVKLPATK